MTPQDPLTTPVPPVLVGAALDCLAFVPRGYQLKPALLIAVTRTVTTNTVEAEALIVRIRATAIVMSDHRWKHWSAYFRTATPQMHQAFDAVMLDCIATLPLDASLKFAPDKFFDALLARLPLAVCN